MFLYNSYFDIKRARKDLLFFSQFCITTIKSYKTLDVIKSMYNSVCDEGEIPYKGILHNFVSLLIYSFKWSQLENYFQLEILEQS